MARTTEFAVIFSGGFPLKSWHIASEMIPHPFSPFPPHPTSGPQYAARQVFSIRYLSIYCPPDFFFVVARFIYPNFNSCYMTILGFYPLVGSYEIGFGQSVLCYHRIFDTCIVYFPIVVSPPSRTLHQRVLPLSQDKSTILCPFIFDAPEFVSRSLS